MNIKKPTWSNTDIYNIGNGFGNILLISASLILAVYLIAALSGGKFLPRAFALYGSWIGTGLILKYISKYFRDKMRMKKYKWYLISLWMIISQVAWFPNYISLFLITFIMFGFIAGYKAQGKPGWHDEQ